jgi:hypothetical protein
MADSDIPTYNIFTGHLGHLSTSQEEALVAFKQALTEAKLYDPAQPSLDDPTLLCVTRRCRLRGAQLLPDGSFAREALILRLH